MQIQYFFKFFCILCPSILIKQIVKLSVYLVVWVFWLILLSEPKDCNLSSMVLANSPVNKGTFTLCLLCGCCSDFPFFSSMLQACAL